MKEAKAFVKPKRVQNLVKGLQEAGFECVTLSEGEGSGAYRQRDLFPSLEFHFTDSSIVKLEWVCQNEEMEYAVQLISEQARTKEPADGIIYVTDTQKPSVSNPGNRLRD